MADDALAGLDDGEEVFLGRDLGVLAVTEGDPTAALLGHLLHLLEAALPEGFEIVAVEAVEGGDLLVDLVLDGLRHRQHLLLDHLFDLPPLHLLLLLLLSDLKTSPSPSPPASNLLYTMEAKADTTPFHMAREDLPIYATHFQIYTEIQNNIDGARRERKFFQTNFLLLLLLSFLFLTF